MVYQNLHNNTKSLKTWRGHVSMKSWSHCLKNTAFSQQRQKMDVKKEADALTGKREKDEHLKSLITILFDKNYKNLILKKL